MIQEIKISHIEQVAKLLIEQPYESDKSRYRSSSLYRGMSNESYRLETSLQRNCKGKQHILETSILRNFAKYAVVENQSINNSIWEQIMLGQHHSLPTRVLDWTYSPLIALHFSTSEKDLSNMEKHDSIIWEVDINEINSLLPDKYKKLLEQENAYLFTVNMLNKLADSIDAYDDAMKNNSMVLIEPPSIDPRIINQYSYFSIIPKDINNIEGFLDKHTKHTKKYIIDRNLRWQIRDMLDHMNTNERIAYPGLDGLSCWLARHYYVK